jgi:hypothetical protein
MLGLITAVMLVTTFSAHAEFVKDSYIITFKKPSGTEKPIIDPPNEMNRGKTPVGMHSTGQSKEKLAAQLNLKGKVVSILETINAVHVNMTADEAQRLSLDPRVLYVQQDMIATAAIQNNPGWALDRLDEVTPLLDNTYNDSPSNGTGRTIYILDSGIALGNATVAAEFGGRASVIWDVNTGGTGNDCFGHGTQVASAAAGNTYGTAKGATVIAAKITTDCTGNTSTSTSTTLFNWLAANAPRGSIANWSYEFRDTTCSNPTFDTTLENAIRAAHNAGVIVVVAAGNNPCNTANYTPTRIQEAFVVGATSRNRIASNGQDEITSFSRFGWNISTFAPGESVATLNYTGVQTLVNGTSFSAPYVAGLFATACQASGTVCNTATSAAPLYQLMRDSGTLNTVTNVGGSTLTGSTSRFLYKSW